MKDFARRDTAASRSAPERKRRSGADSSAAPGRSGRRGAAERPAPTQPGSSRSGTSVLLAFVTGLACGLFLAFLFGIGLPLADGLGSFDIPGRAATGSRPVANGSQAPAATANGQPAPGAGAQPAATRFEFYHMLSEREVLVPQVDDLLPDGSRNTATLATPTEIYLLQAGSFRKPADAEGLRAQLLLLGLDVHTRAVQLDNGDTWNRVLVGPFSSSRELQRARTRLREQDIDAIPMKRRIGGA